MGIFPTTTPVNDFQACPGFYEPASRRISPINTLQVSPFRGIKEPPWPLHELAQSSSTGTSIHRIGQSAYGPCTRLDPRWVQRFLFVPHISNTGI